MDNYRSVDVFCNGKNVSADVVCRTPGVGEYPVKTSGKAEKVELSFLLPIAEVVGFWHPGIDAGPKMTLGWNIDFVCGAQCNYPAFVLLNRDCRCQWGITLTDIYDDIRFNVKMDQEHEGYLFTVTVAVSAETRDFKLRIDNRILPLDELLADWRRELELPECTFPQAAWDGVFCTWYAKHGAVDAAWVEKAAAKVVDWGLKTLIVDDGWCYDEYCRLNPQTIPAWYHTIGDYRISDVKFPDFAEHVRRVQDMGVKYMLWVAPHLIGVDSEFYTKYPDALTGPLVDASRQLDVRHLPARHALAQRLAELMKIGDLDGLKIDFLDVRNPDADAPNARETLAFVKELSSAVRSVKADAMIEFRQNYTNCAMLPFATQFRACDAPFEALKNFGRVAEIRLALGDKLPIHADPAFWSKSDPAECVARHMIAMMGGVPMLSMDVLNISAMEEHLIRYWMEFYQTHQPLLNYGHWHVEFKHQHIAALTVENENEKIVLLNDSNLADEMCGTDGKTLYLANLAERPARWKADQVLDVYGKETAVSAVPVGGVAIRK